MLFVLQTPVLSALPFFVTFAALPVVVALTFDLIVSQLSRSAMAARRGAEVGNDGREERGTSQAEAKRRGRSSETDAVY